MLKLFQEIEIKFYSIEVEIEKKINHAKSVCNGQSELLKGRYNSDDLFKKYENEFNNHRDKLLNQIKIEMNLEISRVNDIVRLHDKINMKALLDQLIKQKQHNLKFKFNLKKLNPKEILKQRLINKQFKFERIFSARNLVKYKFILGLENYITTRYVLFNFYKINDSFVKAFQDENSNLETIRFFIEAGADVNAKDYNKRSALMIASEKGHFEKIKYLVENGADVNGKDYNNKSALMIASKKGHFELAKYLVENGADVNAKNNQNKTALLLAAEKGHLDIVKYLVDNGANVNAKDSYKKTALMFASEFGSLEMVKCLVENGADLSAKGDDEETALILASEKGHLEMVEFLVQKGADVNLKFRMCIYE